ncbi:MAG: hypothetical protein RLZZ623_1913, partial [Actinomycetota bacterium]
ADVPVGQAGRRRTRHRGSMRRVGRPLMLCIVALVILAPIYLNLVNALLPSKYRLAYPPPLYPKDPTFSAFSLAIRRGSMIRYFVNSAVVATAITIGEVITASLAAYAFAFVEFPFRRTLFWVIVGSGLVPFEAIVIGNFHTVARLHWIDSYPALIVPFLASSFGVFLLTRAFRAVPVDLIGAAQLDGSGHLGILRHVVVPVARPSIGALGVLSFLGAWNQYLWPLLVTNRPDRRTIPIGLRQLAGGELNSATVLSAAAVLSLIPVLGLLALFNRQLVRGLTAGFVGQ